ncbi:hypothetical protein JZ751_005866 [Albula glossodonta]|uniref:Uncharacterized protein n=1 Tax=Albula glossodonta TaxID=121402 RepID=A0A8T2P3Q9_9TELE|nr:hypothetical protein JZ751_005866 [Albula glossodonta]
MNSILFLEPSTGAVIFCGGPEVVKLRSFYLNRPDTFPLPLPLALEKQLVVRAYTVTCKHGCTISDGANGYDGIPIPFTVFGDRTFKTVPLNSWS